MFVAFIDIGFDLQYNMFKDDEDFFFLATFNKCDSKKKKKEKNTGEHKVV